MKNNLDSNNIESVPKDIKKWNWGAFFLSFIWGIAHRVYFSLLFFVPLLGFIVPFILGFKGNEWAWKKEDWESVEEFRRSQKKWSRAGIAVVGGSIFMGLVMVIIMFYSFGRMEPVDNALKKLNTNPKAISYLGNNIEKGFWVTGSVSTTGSSGEANVSFPVKGEQGAGKVYMIAKKEMGIWEIKRLVLEIEEENYRFDLLENNSGSI
ncbi:cytochrome c oxidase assembly factor Coa1 family protein [Orenia marismortui]|uniref:cytochrome c oxidase assembly factor Coa1 family protein n=1 Tax=Orenia marismortui TaxID=46469 RepID=UPI000363D88F|nr:cytochrome c oxidase assembly factor Coa1 family protein [Orenia marismortui]